MVTFAEARLVKSSIGTERRPVPRRSPERPKSCWTPQLAFLHGVMPDRPALRVARSTRQRPIESVRQRVPEGRCLACKSVVILGLRGRAGQRLARGSHQGLHVGWDPSVGFEQFQDAQR
jgi:hypothetical protein